MKINKETVITLILIVFIAGFCKSQSTKYRDKIQPKAQAKIDSLYPNATSDIVLNDQYVSDTTQEIRINCHCSETVSMIILIFDTNGNFLKKDTHYNYIKDLPAPIVKYIKDSSSTHVKFNNFMIKSINNKGQISYGIMETEYPNKWSVKCYILRFKSTGELISKKEQILEGR